MNKHQISTKLLRKLAAIALIAITVAHVSIAPLQAQEEAVEETGSTTGTLRERIEKIVEQQKDSVETALDELGAQRRGFIGQVARVAETALTLENKGVSRIVPIDENVTLTRNGTKVQPETVEIDSWAMVLGLKENDSFVPKSITLYSGSLLPDPQLVYLGSLQEIGNNSLVFQPRGEDGSLTIDVLSATSIEDTDGSEASLDDFVEDDQVLLVGYEEDGNMIATTIRALAPLSGNE